MKCSLIVRFRDGTKKEFPPISKATDSLRFDTLPDGTWQLIYGHSEDLLVEDFSRISSFNIHRVD
jgi:hypothetical protein